jgi:putative inorganic carbon (HCO3(-)) transporter
MICRIRNVCSATGDVLCRYSIWLLSGFVLAVLIAQFIISAKFIYLAAIFLTPLIVYVSLSKPFIFPLGFYVFFIPFDELFILTGGRTGPTLTKLIAVLAILVLLLKGILEHKFRKPDSLVTWWLLFFLFCFASVLWSISPDHALYRIPTAVGLITLYLIVSTYKIQNNDYEILKWFVLAGGVVASLMTIYNFQSIAAVDRISLSIGSNTASLNGFAFGLLIPVSLCIEKMLLDKKLLLKILFGSILGVITFSIVITGSRGAMTGVAVIILVYYLSLRNKIALSMLFIIVGIILFSFIPSFFIERWKDAIESGGTGRTTIWQIGLFSLQKYILTGAGLSNFPLAFTEFMSYVPRYKTPSRAPHNIYLGFLVELGIVGFSFMIMAIWQHFKATARVLFDRSFNKVMLRAALSGILVSSFFLDTVWLKSFWLIFMMITMYKYVQIKEAENNFFFTYIKKLLFADK